MRRLLLRTKARMRDAAKPVSEAAVGALDDRNAARHPLFRSDQDGRTCSAGSRGLIGPLLPEQKIGRANLTAAFPEKSPAEIDTILAGVWDNLGRVGAEFAHIDHIWEHDRAHP